MEDVFLVIMLETKLKFRILAGVGICGFSLHVNLHAHGHSCLLVWNTFSYECSGVCLYGLCVVIVSRELICILYLLRKKGILLVDAFCVNG